MALVIPWPSFRQALVRQLRANLVLKDGLLGDWTEGFAPQKTDFPLGVFALHYAPAEYDWTGVVNVVGFDVFIFSKVSAAEAASLYQLAFDTLQDARLYPTGQTSLSCRSVSSLSLIDNDAEGHVVYQTGGTWQALQAQSNPTLRDMSFTIDSVIG